MTRVGRFLLRNLPRAFEGFWANGLLVAAFIGSLTATPALSEIRLPCGTEMVPMHKAEEILAKDGRIFALCSTAPGAAVTYMDMLEAPALTHMVISESEEVIFADRFVTEKGRVFLKVLIPEELKCSEKPPASYVLLSSMTCTFRTQDVP